MTNGTDAQTHTPRPGACCMDCRAGYVSPRNAGSSWNIMQATTMPEGYGSVKEAAESTGLIVRSLGDQVKARAKNAGKQAQDLAGKLKEGPASIKILSTIAGVMLVASGFFTTFGQLLALNAVSALVHVYMFLFGVMILVLEERIPIAPNNFLKFVHEYFAFATEVWGRGAFFFFVGTLAMAQWEFFDIVLGVYLMGLGAGMIFWGRNAYKNLDAVRLQLRDPDVVTAMFFQFDTNTNGVLEETELRELFKSLGAQMRPAEIEAAIMIMDRNNDGKVTLDEFQAWWKMRNPDMANAAAV